MYIYNPNEETSFSQHILDPDQTYHTSHHQEKLYSFFKTLDKPKHIKQIIGIYMEFYVEPYLFEKNPYFYYKLSPKILEQIIHCLDIGHANLYIQDSQKFFLVMFDIHEEDLTKILIQFHHYLIEHSFIYHQHQCTIQMKCGVYFSHIGIHPYHFYTATKEQFESAFYHDNVIISMKHLSL